MVTFSVIIMTIQRERPEQMCSHCTVISVFSYCTPIVAGIAHPVGIIAIENITSNMRCSGAATYDLKVTMPCAKHQLEGHEAPSVSFLLFRDGA